MREEQDIREQVTSFLRKDKFLREELHVGELGGIDPEVAAKTIVDFTRRSSERRMVIKSEAHARGNGISIAHGSEFVPPRLPNRSED